jgi:hypothetical protein
MQMLFAINTLQWLCQIFIPQIPSFFHLQNFTHHLEDSLLKWKRRRSLETDFHIRPKVFDTRLPAELLRLFYWVMEKRQLVPQSHCSVSLQPENFLSPRTLLNHPQSLAPPRWMLLFQGWRYYS